MVSSLKCLLHNISDASSSICFHRLTLQRIRKTRIACVNGWSRPEENIGCTLSAISPSAIACDTPTPSLGDVPRPNSSINTKESGVASPIRQTTTRLISLNLQVYLNRSPRIMADVAISLAKVLKLFSMSSSFESRVRSES